MVGSGIIALDRPTVVCKHGGIPTTLIGNFHVADALMEAFPLLVAHTTYIFWKTGKVAVQKM